ncbi:MAG: nitrile hydratase subunit beta [Sedimentitalea sp.]
MSRVHDMGGRFGDGPVIPEADGIPELPDWQARALALTLASGSLGQWNIDVSRHARECLAPQDYARFSYFEKWTSALADLLVARGVLSVDELSAPGSDRHPLAERKLAASAVAKVMGQGSPYTRDSTVPALFAPGDKVRTRAIAQNTLVAGGHTRLPGYAAGAVGHVVLAHGAHVFPDASAHDLGDAPEPLYAVAFAAADLWAHPEHPRDEVVLDLWQSYLSPA